MKKFIWSVVILLLIGGGYYTYNTYFRTSNRMNPIYAVPPDAAYILEMDEPFDSWDKFSKSDVWNHLKKNPLMAEITHMVDSMDQEWRSNETISKYVGSRPMILSGHPIKDKLEYFFVVDLEEASQFIGFKNVFMPLMEKYYTVNIRKYHEYEILELYDEEYHETLYLAIIDNLLIGSYRHPLVEASLDQLGEPVIGRDLSFIEVKENLGYGGWLRFYIQWKVMLGYIRNNFEDEEYLSELSDVLLYTGFDFSYDESDKLIKLEGYTTTEDTVTSIYNIFNQTGGAELTIPTVLSKRTAVYNGLGFSDAEKLNDYLNKMVRKDNQEYAEAQQKLENFLDIKLEEHFFGWIDNEMAVGKFYNDTKTPEYAFIIKATDSLDAKENLDFIAKRIKRKTPVKFKQIDYRGYEINFMSINGFFKLLLGNMLKEIDKPYYTIIGDYVLFSNHPQTLRGIIDDYLAGNTLSNDPKFIDYKKLYDDKSSAFLYSNTDYLVKDSKSYLDKETYDKLSNNTDYVYCFPVIGLQINSDGGLYKSSMYVPYSNLSEATDWLTTLKKSGFVEYQADTNTLFYDSLFISAENTVESEEAIEPIDINPDDLDAKKYQEFYENGELKVEVGLKDGLKHGTYLEYNPNGIILLKGKFKNDLRDGAWKQYDSLGNVVKRIRYRNGQEL
ncbi:MAG: DUF3352 domain-containing protein [Cyclobacteriaceae bacterium]|nr:DUF3352 domain-containing protein [Cyclobacteriaceae bacterium]